MGGQELGILAEPVQVSATSELDHQRTLSDFGVTVASPPGSRHSIALHYLTLWASSGPVRMPG